MTTERTLTPEETKVVYKKLCALVCSKQLKPFDIQYDADCSEFYYDCDGVQYRVIYDRPGDWFLDIIYVGVYK